MVAPRCEPSCAASMHGLHCLPLLCLPPVASACSPPCLRLHDRGECLTVNATWSWTMDAATRTVAACTLTWGAVHGLHMRGELNMFVCGLWAGRGWLSWLAHRITKL